MIFCKYCGTITQPVMSFSKDKNEKYNRCPKCHSETKHVPIDKNELNFDQCLHNEIKKY